MGIAYWIKSYLLAAGPLFLILAGVEFVKGSSSGADFLGALAWAMVAAALFIGARYQRFRKSQACAPCDGDPKRD